MFHDDDLAVFLRHLVIQSAEELVGDPKVDADERDLISHLLGLLRSDRHYRGVLKMLAVTSEWGDEP
jgi:hypothetical protein